MKEYELVNVNIKDLIFDGQNPNIMTEQEEKALELSMDKYGFLVPIIIDNNKIVADGEHRVEMYKKKGLETIPAYVVDFKSEADRKLFRQIANKVRGTHDIVKDIKEFEIILKEFDKKLLSESLAISESQIDDILKLKEAEIENYIQIIEQDKELNKNEYNKIIKLNLTKEQKTIIVNKLNENHEKIMKVVDYFIQVED